MRRSISRLRDDTSEHPGRESIANVRGRVRRRVEHVGVSVNRLRGRYEQRWYARLVANYTADDADVHASTIAFGVLFTVLPILAFTAAASSLVHQLSGISVGEELDVLMRDVWQYIWSFLLVAIAIVLFGGGRLYNAFDRAFAVIYRTPRRPFVKRRLLATLTVPLISAVLLISSIAISLASAFLTSPVTDAVPYGARLLQILLGYGAAFVVVFVIMAVAYGYIPTNQPGVRRSLIGAALAAALFVLMTQMFPLYVKLTGGFEVAGSEYGIVILVMFWLYLFGQIVVIGAEVNALRLGVRDAHDNVLRAQPAPDTPATTTSLDSQ
jgi:YihY family inner membrane protein